ncbi:hypothetical protein JQC92_00195 [Shewanella sp. 202IG2-18]|uniref:hypothetical protein n=1 Tax=Parashewanella hymeniacidonis TaxID=2807618 RepID=UPI00195FC447|nr:hypothetical protein [Parashewanella hymeniacidonis]MBM7070474.1 hypothetical protein [Parashewanella hymeniacidonis]
MDIIRAKDNNFEKTRMTWNKVKKTEVSAADKLEEKTFRIRERCPITGEVLTKETAVRVKLIADSTNGRKEAVLLMSRRGIKSERLRDKTINDTVSRERLLTAEFSKVENEHISERHSISRAWRIFFGGDVAKFTYHYVQAGGHSY